MVFALSGGVPRFAATRGGAAEKFGSYAKVILTNVFRISSLIILFFLCMWTQFTIVAPK